MDCKDCPYSNEIASDEHCSKCIEEATNEFDKKREE